jgi:glycosyltransferase involved in cell wall biosynthesis
MTLLTHVFTSSKFVPFVLPLLVGLKERGYELCTISSDGPELSLVEELGVPVHRVTMTRTISPLVDLSSLVQLTRLLKKLRPDVVHAHNPKAGLLAMLAARSASISCRVYHAHGSPLLTSTRLQRGLFWLTESLSHSFATAPLAVSRSLGRALTEAGVMGAERSRVLGQGSASGIDIERFQSDSARLRGSHLREQHQIPQDALVVGFAGRLILEKGIRELDAAWKDVAQRFPDVYLVIAGAPDGADPSAVERLFRGPRTVRLGQVSDMVALYEALDVFVLPSYREGLSTVLLEAMASGVPTIAARTVGTVDVIEAEVTGVLVPPRDSAALALALKRLLLDAGLRHKLGTAGREFVVQFFERSVALNALVAFYAELGFPPP